MGGDGRRGEEKNLSWEAERESLSQRLSFRRSRSFVLFVCLFVETPLRNKSYFEGKQRGKKEKKRELSSRLSPPTFFPFHDRTSAYYHDVRRVFSLLLCTAPKKERRVLKADGRDQKKRDPEKDEGSGCVPKPVKGEELFVGRSARSRAKSPLSFLRTMKGEVKRNL